MRPTASPTAGGPSKDVAAARGPSRRASSILAPSVFDAYVLPTAAPGIFAERGKQTRYRRQQRCGRNRRVLAIPTSRRRAGRSPLIYCLRSKHEVPVKKV